VNTNIEGEMKTEELIYGKKVVTADELKQWSKEAPYFVLPAVMALRTAVNMTPARRRELSRRIAIQASDRQALVDLIGEENRNFAHFYPETSEQPTTGTEDTIDTFLKTFGHADDRETEILTNLIFNPVPDYAATLAAEAAAARDTGKSRLRQPLTEQQAVVSEQVDKEPVSKSSDSEPYGMSREPSSLTTDTGNLSESFAKIMIRNGNYSKALEIITGLSLNNSEKSVYFAHQIRFLRKLMLNQSKQQAKRKQ